MFEHLRDVKHVSFRHIAKSETCLHVLWPDMCHGKKSRSKILKVPRQVYISGSWVPKVPRQVYISGSWVSRVPRSIYISGSRVPKVPRQVYISGSWVPKVPRQVYISGSWVSKVPCQVHMSRSGIPKIPLQVLVGTHCRIQCSQGPMSSWRTTYNVPQPHLKPTTYNLPPHRDAVWVHGWPKLISQNRILNGIVG